MTGWIVAPAHMADLPEIARLVNSAYRGEGARQGWTSESELLDGQRTDPATLAEDLAGPDPSTILVLREVAVGPILACVFLEKGPAEAGPPACTLGMLTVAPALQARGLGRVLIEKAEDFARGWGAARMAMTVISVRDALIAWYERRGYVRTGATKPFPYGDERFGLPRRDDLQFVVLEKPL